MQCKGILGFLFGHKYQGIYDVDQEKYSAEEIKKVAEVALEYNFWAYENKMNPSDNNVKRTTKVYLGHVCQRCGDFKERESIKI